MQSTPPVTIVKGPTSQRDFGNAPDSEVMEFLRNNISGVENNGYSFTSNGVQYYVTTNEQGGRFLTSDLEEFYDQQQVLGPDNNPITPADFA